MAEVALVLGLLLVWLLSEGVRTARSLWILFFYSFPSEFLIGLLPHEPVLLYYGETYAAFTVALVAVTSTVLTEALNYSFLGYFNTAGMFEAARRRPVTRAIIDLFERAPFLAIVVAGFTPIPFFPVRFLVVMTGYPIGRYCLGVAIARAPRFFLLAAIGHAIHFPGWALALIFAGLILPLYLPVLRRWRREPARQAEAGSGPAGAPVPSSPSP